jgi:transcriptional regulator with XRE-family HTH domain
MEREQKDSESIGDETMRKKVNYELALELYHAGLTDNEIASKCEVSQSTISHWRKKNNLPKISRYGRQAQYNIQELYDKGLRDCEISIISNVSPANIMHWRMTRNLPPNNPPLSAIRRKENETLEKEFSIKNTVAADPESLFCDGNFLEKITRKPIKRYDTEHPQEKNAIASAARTLEFDDDSFHDNLHKRDIGINCPKCKKECIFEWVVIKNGERNLSQSCPVHGYIRTAPMVPAYIERVKGEPLVQYIKNDTPVKCCSCSKLEVCKLVEQGFTDICGYKE